MKRSSTAQPWPSSAPWSTVTTLGVFFRYVLNNALPWAEEADRYLFIWLSFVGASITMRHKAHIAVDILVRTSARLAPAARACCPGLRARLPGGCLLGERPGHRGDELRPRATATDIPMSWVYMAAPVGCMLIAIETLRLMARTWAEMRRRRTRNDLVLLIALRQPADPRGPRSRSPWVWPRSSPSSGRARPPQHGRHPDGLGHGLLPAHGHPLLHSGGRVDGASGDLGAAGAPGQSHGRAHQGRPGDGRAGGRSTCSPASPAPPRPTSRPSGRC